MLCRHSSYSQVSLAAHFSSCDMYLGYARTSSTTGCADNCTKRNCVDQLEHTKFYDCKICSAKFVAKRIWEIHEIRCENQCKEGKNPLTSSLMEPELPIIYYCNICLVRFDEKHSWESHLAKCEYQPKKEKEDQNALASSFTKELPKDVLYEKVIEDESWLVTSLPEGYECVDAMFVVEAEGTCMLQQEIPVEPEEEQLEVFQFQKEQDQKVNPNERMSPLEQDLLTPWSLSLLPGSLETEEEKEMMEQKLVLEPRQMHSAFVCVRGRPPKDFKERIKETLEHPLILPAVEIQKEPNVVEEEDPSSDTDVSVKMEPKEVQIKEDNEKSGEMLEEESKVHPEDEPSGSPPVCLEQLRVVDTQVACH